jgi:hypothetical protein
MEQRHKILNKYFAKADIGGAVSINDLREKEMNGALLSLKEKQALANFDRFRIAELKKQSDDLAFHERYRQLQIMANLGDFEEFLKEKYNQVIED